MNNITKKLWKDYYSVLKPYCSQCLEKGISKEEYAFCSTAKKPVPIYQEDAWGRRGKLITIFEDIYECNVYHWTIYQNHQ